MITTNERGASACEPALWPVFTKPEGEGDVTDSPPRTADQSACRADVEWVLEAGLTSAQEKQQWSKVSHLETVPQSLSLSVWSPVPDPSRRHVSASGPRRTGPVAAAVDPSQRSRVRGRSPEVDLCLFVPAAALRHIRCLLLCAHVAHIQDVLCAQTARPARARHPETGERTTPRQCVCTRMCGV